MEGKVRIIIVASLSRGEDCPEGFVQTEIKRAVEKFSRRIPHTEPLASCTVEIVKEPQSKTALRGPVGVR